MARTETARTAPTLTERTAATPTEPTARTRTEPTAPDPRPKLRHLKRLVGDEARFLADHFGREAFRRRLPVGEASRLFSWDLLNRVLAQHRLGPPRLKLEQSGREVGREVFRERRPRPNQVLHDIDVPALYEHLRGGATLILDGVNELHPPLQRLAAGLAGEFCASGQTNLYACWGETQGFDVHWDDHDVFVIQVHGAKRWDLYGFTQPAPQRRGRQEPAPRPTYAPEQITLEAGDVLYLPRGYWHAALGLGGPSLHLTVGLSRKTGADLLHWLADEAMLDDAVRADLRLERDDATLGAQVAQVLQKMLARGDPADLGRRYRRHVEATRAYRPHLSFPDIGLAQAALAPSTRLRLTDGASGVETRADASAVVLSHRGVRYTLAAETGAVLHALVAGESLSCAEIIALCRPASERLARDFIMEMLRQGVLARETGE